MNYWRAINKDCKGLLQGARSTESQEPKSYCIPTRFWPRSRARLKVEEPSGFVCRFGACGLDSEVWA